MILHTNSFRRPSGRADEINLISTAALNPFQKICYKVSFRNVAPSRGLRLCRPWLYIEENHILAMQESLWVIIFSIVKTTEITHFLVKFWCNIYAEHHCTQYFLNSNFQSCFSKMNSEKNFAHLQKLIHRSVDCQLCNASWCRICLYKTQ